MTKEVLKLALEALEPLVRRAAPWGELDWLNGCKAIAAIKEALAQPEQALDKLFEVENEQALQEKVLQALHDENERLGLYDDAYGIPFVEKDQLKKLLNNNEIQQTPSNS